MSTISVIIPAYNSAGYLPDALDSALNQTHREIQIVVVDDGSTDGTADLMSSYEKANPGRIQYVHQANRGVAAARNNGLRQARGSHVAFLDSDDYWEPTKLEKQLACFRSNPQVGLVYCDNLFVDAQGKAIANYLREVKLIEGDILPDLFQELFLMTPGIVLKKECVDRVGFFDETLHVGEDYEYWLRIAAVYPAGVVREKLWYRRVHEKSLSRQDYRLDAENDIQTLLKFLKDHPSFGKKHAAQARRRLGDCYFSLAYRLLEEGHNGLAFANLLKALRYQPSARNVKNLALCAVPPSVRRTLKAKVRV